MDLIILKILITIGLITGCYVGLCQLKSSKKTISQKNMLQYWLDL